MKGVVSLAYGTMEIGWESRPSTVPFISIAVIWAIPLVYCGNVGMIPVGMEEKEVKPDDLIVATRGTHRVVMGYMEQPFPLLNLTSESESLSGGAVQIGNAITEKMVLDVLIQARDRGLVQRGDRLWCRRFLKRRG